MSDIAIKVENLSKRYRIGAQQESYKTLRDMLSNAASAPLRWARAGRRGAAQSERDFWALNDVSFEVRRGEVVGIIGRNGAGKSTLLKILSRITEPTSGTADIYGRVGSLLEVGTGFHPELTGRENIYLNGAILGMKREEIARQFDAIVEFAEVEKFVDTAVKHYSSGMYLRLAFAVAAHLEPEILLVDEVLAVGDAQFQKKCLGKMGEVAKEGRTVFFVSHNMAAVESLCTRVIWFSQGETIETGQPTRVISNYLQSSLSSVTSNVWNDISTAPGNDQVRLHKVAVYPQDGLSSDTITMTTPVVLEFEYWNLDPQAHLNLSLHVYNELGTMAFNSTSLQEPNWHGRPFPKGLFRSLCYIPADLLNEGIHRIELLIVKDQNIVLYRAEDVLVFDVREAIEMRDAWFGKWPGVVHPLLKWTTVLEK